MNEEEFYTAPLDPLTVDTLEELAFLWLVKRLCFQAHLAVSRDTEKQKNETREQIRIVVRGFVKAGVVINGSVMRLLIRRIADEMERRRMRNL